MVDMINATDIRGICRPSGFRRSSSPGRTRRRDRARPVPGRSIAGATYVELPGRGSLLWSGDQEALLREIEHFITGSRPAPQHDRVLATVLFTDIVGSTDRAAETETRDGANSSPSTTGSSVGRSTGSRGER